MKRYSVQVTHTETTQYTVEADNPSDAARFVEENYNHYNHKETPLYHCDERLVRLSVVAHEPELITTPGGTDD
jgi:hypothetical protein